MKVLLISSSHGKPWIPVRPGLPPIDGLAVNATGGRHASDVVNELRNKRMVHSDTQLVVVFLGGNDIEAGHDASTIVKKLQEVVTGVTLQAPQATVVVLGLIPRPKPRQFSPEHFNTIAKMVNKELSTLTNCYIERIHNLFLSKGTNHTILTNLYHDGVHLNVDGQAKLHRILRRIKGRFLNK